MHAHRQLKQGMFVNESSAPTRSRILYVVIRAKRLRREKAPIVDHNRRVFVLVKPRCGNSRTCVITQHRLNKFSDEILKTPLYTCRKFELNCLIWCLRSFDDIVFLRVVDS